jgi:hypothetical protein
MLITEWYVNRLAEIVSGFFERELQVSIVDLHQLVLRLKQAQDNWGENGCQSGSMRGGSMLEQISQGYHMASLIIWKSSTIKYRSCGQ